MATAVAQTLEFNEQFEPVTTLSRKEAIALARDGQTAIHEHITDPRIYRAAAGLIEGHRNGRKVDIEAYGFPYDVLENTAEQLAAAGATHYVSAQILGALEDYIINMGSDFSREAKAKPLYARIMVTSTEPDDLPECQQTQATMIDGVRKIGGEAARVNVQATVYGTKSTTSQGVDLNQMFASKTDGLFVFFGSPTNEAIKGFDSVDNGLVNLMQGMAGAGGAVSAAVIEEIKQMIKNGEATPEVLKLLENMAGLKQLTEAMMTPGAVENGQAKLTELVQQITQQLASGIESGAIPQILVQASIAVVANMKQNEVLAAIMVPEATPVAADNDNQAVVEKPAVAQPSIVDMLPELAQQGAADLKQMIEALKQSPSLPEALAEIVAKIDPATMTVEQLTEALQGQGELATDVQQLILTLNDPEVKQAMPQETLNSVNQFIAKQPELIEAVTTVAVIQSLQTALPALEANSPEAAQIQQVINDLKNGVETIQTITPDKIAPVALKLEGTPAAQMLDKAAQTVTNAQAAPVVLSNDTMAVIAAVVETPGLDTATKEALTEALKNGDQKVIADIVKNNPTILETAPPEARATLETVVEAANIELPTPVDPVVTQTLQTLVVSPVVSPEVKAEIQKALESGDPKVVQALLKDQPVVAASLPVIDKASKGTAPAEPPAPPSQVITPVVKAPESRTTSAPAVVPTPATNGNTPSTGTDNKPAAPVTHELTQRGSEKAPDPAPVPEQKKQDPAKPEDKNADGVKPSQPNKGAEKAAETNRVAPSGQKPSSIVAPAIVTQSAVPPDKNGVDARAGIDTPKDNTDIALKEDFQDARDVKAKAASTPENTIVPTTLRNTITPAEIIEAAPIVPGAAGGGNGNGTGKEAAAETIKVEEAKKGGGCCAAFGEACANCGKLSDKAEKASSQRIKELTDGMKGKTFAVNAVTLG